MRELGEYVYIPDRLVRKDITSLTDSLAKVIGIEDWSITLRLTNNKIVTRNFEHIVPFNLSEKSNFNIDILDLPLFGKEMMTI